MSSHPVMATAGFHWCHDCERIWHYTQLNEMEDMGARLAASDGAAPSGDCPDCGAFCYPTKCAIPDLTKDPEVNWNNNLLQFSRLIAELEAIGVFAFLDAPPSDPDRPSMQQLRDATDLSTAELMELVERAQAIWDNIKDNTVANQEDKHGR